MIEQSFNYTDPAVKETTKFFQTRVKNLELEEEKMKYSAAAKKSKDKKSAKKHKQADSDSKVIESGNVCQTKNLHSTRQMLSFYGQLQGSTCHYQQAQTEVKEKLQVLRKKQRNLLL